MLKSLSYLEGVKFQGNLKKGPVQEVFIQQLKIFYRQCYFEAIDFAIASINSRFDQKGFHIYSKIEQLLFKAASGEAYESEFSIVCDFYKDDFDVNEFEAQLKTLCREKMEASE